MVRLLPLFVVLLATLTVAPAAPTTYIVNAEGTGDAPTIQAGIDLCVAGDTVLVTCGTYYEHDIVMKSGVCLRSETGDHDCVTIDAQQLGRVISCFYVDSTTIVEGLTLTRGAPINPGHGGGLWCYDAAPLIANCRFLENTTGASGGLGGKGGGMRCDFTYTTVRDCVFENNDSSWGGGVYVADRGPTFTGCQFINNVATQEGGGLFLYISDAPVVGCTFIGNEAPLGGGLTNRWLVSSPVTECLFTENSADSGGAIFLESLSTPPIDRCTFVRNVAIKGSAMYLRASSNPTVSASIIASGVGGGPFLTDVSRPILLCSDIFANEGGDWTGCIADQLGTNGNISADPLFCDEMAGDFRLRSDSPCLPGSHPDGWSCGVIGLFGVGCPVSGAGEDTVNDGTPFLGESTPNPFYSSTRITYEVPASSGTPWIRLQVFDVAGRLVRVLVEGPHEAGIYEVPWHGLSDTGDHVAAGIYFYRLNVNGEVFAKRTILVR